MSIEIRKPGLLTTIQDLGRYGYRKHGVVVSGVMDEFAHRIANVLVGNEEAMASLEITLVGPEILIGQDCLLSICGGDLSPMIDGKEIPMWRPIWVRKNSILHFGQNRSGARAYIAFAGSFDIKKVMGSCSTYMKAKIGGAQGRKLEKGDVLPLGKPSPRIGERIEVLREKNQNKKYAYPKWFIGNQMLPYSTNPVIKVVKGEQFYHFDEESRAEFFQKPFQVTAQSDRMGYRLKGVLLRGMQKQEMLSEAVALGTIQIPSDGNPILLLADCQTTGGYPRFSHVIKGDIPKIAQLKPGDSLYFCEITLEQAQKELINREKNIQQIKKAIEMKMREEYEN